MVDKSLYSEKGQKYYGHKRSHIIELIGSENLGDLLDVGGSDGATAAYLVDTGQANTGLVVDPFSGGVESDNIDFLDENVEREGFFGDLAKAGRSFDTVFFLDVLEHLVNPWGVLDGLSAVHPTGGKLVICVPNARYAKVVLPLLLFGRFDYKYSGVMDRTHLRWFTRATATEMVEEAGYKVDAVHGVSAEKAGLFNKLTLGLFRPFTDVQYVVIATKI